VRHGPCPNWAPCSTGRGCVNGKKSLDCKRLPKPGRAVGFNSVRGGPPRAREGHPGPFGRSPASRTRAGQYEREGLFYVCLYCADLDDVHWSDSGGGKRGELSPSGVRVRRLRQLRELLAPYRWTVDQPGSTRQLVLSSPTGSTELVADLGALWFLTDRLLPNRLDPLDPELLSRLEAGADRRGFEA